jgi:hypothetical protein
MKLKHPFKSQTTGQEITEITITRRPKARDIYRAHEHSKSEARQTGFLIALLSDRTPDEIAELDIADFAELGKEVSDFLESNPENSAAR